MAERPGDIWSIERYVDTALYAEWTINQFRYERKVIQGMVDGKSDALLVHR